MARLFSYKKISSTVYVPLSHETMAADSPMRSATAKDSQFSIQSANLFMPVIYFFCPPIFFLVPICDPHVQLILLI